MKFSAALGLLCLASLGYSAPSTGVISQGLIKEFETKATTTVVVSIKGGVSQVYRTLERQSYASTLTKTVHLRESLIANAAHSQKAVISLLSDKKADFTSFWISNRIIIKNADYSLVQHLAAHNDVLEVRSEHQASVSPIQSTSFEILQGPNQWGVETIKAPAVWAQGFQGQDVIVSNIDTGVRGTHSILKDNFLGAYGWYDPSGRTAAPVDGHGHGTHTMGTIAGANGYGVAPKAKWMACNGCNGGGCTESDLLGCAQFITCPHLPDGSNPDCTKKPHLVSNSWGSSLGGQTWYDDAIKAWHTAGIIPIFSAGNSGPSCRTVGSPGDRDVIGVAATDSSNSIAYFSSIGPASNTQDHKPDISAPGVNVVSAGISSDTAFATMSGTSMACPHIAGAVALLLNKTPSLKGNYKEVREMLITKAVKTGLVGNNNACGGNADNQFPNYTFGHGLADVSASAGLRNSTIIF